MKDKLLSYLVHSFQDFLNFVRNKTGLEDTKKYDLYQLAELVPGALMCEVRFLHVNVLYSRELYYILHVRVVVRYSFICRNVII